MLVEGSGNVHEITLQNPTLSRCRILFASSKPYEAFMPFLAGGVELKAKFTVPLSLLLLF